MRRLGISIIAGLLSLAAWAQGGALSVESCVEMAMNRNVDVRNASLDVTAARLQKQEAFAEYFPTVSAVGIAFHSLNPMIDISLVDIVGRTDMGYMMQDQLEQMAAPYGLSTHYKALQYGYSGALTLSQPVYAGGRVATGNRLASLGEDAARLKWSLQKRQSEESVRKLFYQVLALQRKQETLEFTSSVLDKLRADVSAAVEAGLALETDLTSVELKQAELKAGRSKLDMGLRIAKMSLLNTVGMKYNAYKSVPSEYPYIDTIVLEGSMDGAMTPEQAYVDEEALADALDEAALLQVQVRARQLEKRMALGEALPSLVFGASYGHSRFVSMPKMNGTVYAILQIPLSDWGKNSRKLERMDLEIQKAENQRDFYRSQLVLQMRQLYMELCCAYEQMQIAADAEALAARRFDQLQRSYEAGMCTLSELLLCENEYRSASENAVDAALDYVTSLQEYRLRARQFGEYKKF